MEPIVLLGFIAVVYGGYVSVMELAGDISVLLRLKKIRSAGQEFRLKPHVKKMARLYG